MSLGDKKAKRNVKTNNIFQSLFSPVVYRQEEFDHSRPIFVFESISLAISVFIFLLDIGIHNYKWLIPTTVLLIIETINICLYFIFSWKLSLFNQQNILKPIVYLQLSLYVTCIIFFLYFYF